MAAITDLNEQDAAPPVDTDHLTNRRPPISLDDLRHYYARFLVGEGSDHD